MPIYESVGKDRIYQLLMTTQIKEDCITLIALSDLIAQPILALAFLPMYALFAEEIENTIGEKGEVFSISNDSPFNISAVRSKLKLFGGEKLGKAKKKVLNLDKLQGDIFKNKLKFNFTRELNVHYNLGIFFTEEGRILGNTQYFYYMFEERNIDGREYNKEEIREFSKSIGTVLGSVDEGLKDFMPEYNVNVKNKDYRLKFKDFNTDRKSFTSVSKLQYGKDISLILLHVLSSINFVRFVLDDALENDNTYLFKVKYISLYYSIKSMENIIKFFKSNNVDYNIYNSLKEFTDGSTFLLNSNFRNCMMHYRYALDGEYLISDTYLDINLKLYGLVETYFDGRNYNEVDSLITERLYHLSDMLEDLLNIDRSNLRYL